jgi:chemotaxis protein CheX
MVGVTCRRSWDSVPEEVESVTAVVGFGGLLTGACVLRCGGSAATDIAGRMTGMQFPEIDDTVKDAIGEICNMVAGTWKSKVPELAAHCDLSVPAVITGRDYRLRVQAPEFTLRHGYRFDDACFDVTILCDGLR